VINFEKGDIMAVVTFLLSMILFVILLIWILILQNSVDRLSGSITFLSKQLDDLRRASTVQLSEKTVVQATSEPVITESAAKQEAVVPSSEVVKPVVVNQIKQVNTEKSFDFEKAFLGNIFNKVGALAIIIALVIFVKLVSPFIVITPVMKLILGYIAGLGMACGALIMHKKEGMKNYSEVLLGTGFAVLFINSFCGYSLFHLFSTTTAVGVGAVLLLSTYLIADRMKTLSMLVIGLIGGYLTPIFAGADNNVALSYLIFLNLVSLIFTLRNRNTNIINLLNLIITMFVMVLTHIFTSINSIFVVVLWGIYIIYDILRIKDNSVDTVLSWLNYFVLAFLSIIVFKDAHVQLGYMFATTAFVYLVSALASRFLIKSPLYKHYEYFSLINLWLYVLFILNDVYSVVVWSLTGLLLALFISKFDLQYLKNMLIFYFSTAFASALLVQNDGSMLLMQQLTPVLNLRTFVFALPALSMWIAGILLKSRDSKIYNLLNFGALSLGYIYAIGEINSLMVKVAGNSSLVDFNKYMIYTIIGFVYALQTKRLFISTKYTIFNIASVFIGIIALLMLIFGSYSYPQSILPVLNLRFAAYLFAISACFVFVKWTKSDFYKYLAVILGFFLVHTESVGIYKFYENMQYIISVAWVLYSGVITTVGILSNRRYLINSGIFLIILTILRIFIFDLAKVDALYKLIAFLVLGIILMFVSYIYTSRKNKN